MEIRTTKSIQFDGAENKKWVSVKSLYAWIGEFDSQTDGKCSAKHVFSELSKSLKGDYS